MNDTVILWCGHRWIHVSWDAGEPMTREHPGIPGHWYMNWETECDVKDCASMTMADVDFDAWAERVASESWDNVGGSHAYPGFDGLMYDYTPEEYR